MFRKLDLFPSSGEEWETPTIVGFVRKSIPQSSTKKKTMFRKTVLSPSSGEVWETPTLLSPLTRTNLSHWTTHVSTNTVT
jgi:hypothetical protein